MTQLTQKQKRYSLKMTRTAVYIVFFVAGAIFANWVSRIPQIQESLGMSEAILGLVLLGGSSGVLAGLAFASGIIARYGSHNVTIIGGLLMSLSLAILGLAFNPISLLVVLFFLGIFMSAMDVAMNAQAVEVERLADKPIMSSFHAAWSIGTFVGALYWLTLCCRRIHRSISLCDYGRCFLRDALNCTFAPLEN